MNIHGSSHSFLCLEIEFRNANQENDHKPEIRCLTKRGSEGWDQGQGAETKKKKKLEQGIFNVLMYAPTPVLISLGRRKTDILAGISVGL